MKSFKALFCTLAFAALCTGCAINRSTATVDPAAKLDSIKTVEVRKYEKDERGTDKVIADNLRARGYQVVTAAPPSGKVDAVVTYVDKWVWDITFYMLELTIQVREPGTDFPLASGNSMHTSLNRKSPAEMVDEVIGNILKEGKTK